MMMTIKAGKGACAMERKEASQALALLGPRMIIPYHRTGRNALYKGIMDILMKAAESKSAALRAGMKIESGIISFLLPSLLEALYGL